MSDWEIVSASPYAKIGQNKKSQAQSDWEVTTNQKEDETVLSKLPRNIASGLAEGGHDLLNAPHDYAKMIEQQVQKFAGLIPLEKYGVQTPKPNYSIADMIPTQKNYNFAEMLGQKGEPTFLDKSIQNLMQYSPELLMGANALKDVIPHLTKRGASKTLRQARQLGLERNMGPLDINPELIEDTRQFLPNTMPYRNALENAHYGDYQKLFDLQSDVGKHAAAKAKDWFSSAVRAEGREGLSSRNRLLDAMHESLKSQGHNDISDLLKQGQNEYRRYMKFKPYRNILGTAAIATALPKNALINMVSKIVSHKTQ